MDTSRLEELLEQLVEKQGEMISQLESLKTTVKYSLSTIHDELNWRGEEPSFAKEVLSTLEYMTNKLDFIAVNTME